MSDYGHELEFGLFPTPDAARAFQVLELAGVAEVSGLDLVTVQDHPYQARHLDAWTLLSVIAARTSTLRVAPNVANLPLRNPVVLVEGVHHRALGVHSGPAPAHPVGIWVGAYKPRMLRLTGRLADGWLPSAGYAGPELLGEMNARIDDAASAAGRAPEAVRRLYNVSGSFAAPGAGGSGLLRGRPADWAERLAELTLAHGMATYILATDDVDDVRRFGEEVAPLVRDLVATERERRAAGEADAGGPASVQVRAARSEARGGEKASAAAESGGKAPVVTPTPDDGSRLTGILPWDEASRPTYPVGPEAAEQWGYRPAQLAVPQHLKDVHDHLRSELTQVRDIVAQVTRGHLGVAAARSSVNAMTMRQNNWTLGAYCESYCRVVTTHHTLEDTAMFPHLRASDPDAAPVIDRLEEEHEAIHDVLDDVDRALVALVADEAGGLERLQQVVDVLTDTLLSHLAYEERELLHPLARHGFYR